VHQGCWGEAIEVGRFYPSQGGTIILVRDELRKCGRTLALDYISGSLKKLQGLELVNNVRGRWSLTIVGRNALNDLERMVKDFRTDK
jgi:hypothetical protein